MDLQSPGVKPAGADASVSLFSSAVPIERFRFKSCSALIGLSNDLHFAVSEDKREWRWDPRPVFRIDQREREHLVLVRAFRHGRRIYVVLGDRRRAQKRMEKSLLILDGEDPWRVERYIPDLSVDPEAKLGVDTIATLEKPRENPILMPDRRNAWEAFTTLNPAAVLLDGRVHLLYRAQGFDYVSSIGYAASQDGIRVSERLAQPIFHDPGLARLAREGKASPRYASAGGLGGCEDPRATVIDEKVYMSYVSYDGWSPPRLALTSISVEDFLTKRWRWRAPVYISPPGKVDKSGAIFPRKIGGKHAIMHRVFPDIQIDLVDDLDFDGSRFLRTRKVIPVRPVGWDSRKIGAGAPPLWTEEGWLLIYYGVDDQDDREYHVGAMLLDHEDPAKVLYRSPEPAISPVEPYERQGFKPGICYPCGAVIKDGNLIVYYGAADNFVCAAMAPLDTFLRQLKESDTPRLAANDQTEIMDVLNEKK